MQKFKLASGKNYIGSAQTEHGKAYNCLE